MPSTVFNNIDREGFPAAPPSAQPWKSIPRPEPAQAIEQGLTIVARGELIKTAVFPPSPYGFGVGPH
ncbi:hypothetical protein B0T14DRAFT_565314 [Immersiella caudata]|uniref:Uncharacterized protein n=1 Tax=Immersiella caudata TaxID=314043 RepID=A0AA40C4I5_9PEZI|nr:hypothetical protein B0T14DRAFT_565314 [Immersiella caudata]